MKKVNTLVLLLLLNISVFGQLATRKIQIAILFDTSGSMEGLIEQAKSTIWSVVNTASKMNVDGQIPALEISLYDYGNSGISTPNWIRQRCNLITDLDSISGQLFSLSTNGGEEFCATVIQSAMKDLAWSSNAGDLKLIYIAGNEMFNQGPDDYKAILKVAAQQNIVVNTIYCGPYEQGVRELWFDAAKQGQGSFFNIDANREAFHIDTPYDKEIQQLNDSINQTYIGYGQSGVYRMEKQKKEDMNASVKGNGSSVERAMAKSSMNYKNDTWDLVDGVKNGTVKLAEVKAEDLPENMKGMSVPQQEQYIKEQGEKRVQIQQKIQQLSIKRNSFIEEEKKKMDESKQQKDLGQAITESLKTTGKSNGFNVE